MKNIFLILRAVAAVVVTAKYFKLQQSVYPGQLFECITDALKDRRKDISRMSFYLGECDEGWSSSEHLVDRICVNILPDASIITITVWTRELQRSLEWYFGQFAELDTNIINALKNCISECVLDLSDKIEVENKLYFTDSIKEGDVLLRSIETKSVPAWEIAVFPEEAVIKINIDGQPTEQTAIPWRYSLKWLK